jgi:hypothetical protein
MDREHVENFLNYFIGKKIVIKMSSDYYSCILCMRPKSVEFLEELHKSKVSDSLIKYCSVSILDKNSKFQIEYENVENVKYKDIDLNQLYEIQLIYSDGTKIQIYSEETF